MSITVREGIDLLPNLGAEEGDDWRAYRDQPRVRTAAHLWCLLFGSDARLRVPDARGDWSKLHRNELWPTAFESPADPPAFEWLVGTPGPFAWLNTESLANETRAKLATELFGPSPATVGSVHDKAFAVAAAAELGLAPRQLAPLVRILESKALRAPDELLPRLDHELANWPAWSERRFTLKPRIGSSGRGRVAGRDRVDTPDVRGALPRLAERGGAIFEPWVDRVGDYSVSLMVPRREERDGLPTILGSLEMWSTPSGLYRGHCGEVDSRGRVFSGDPEDETLRADAAAVASRAYALGFTGPCGVDSFRYREGAKDDRTARERMRGAVEFNARTTMGLVTIGLVRRALPIVREALSLTPGDRRGFALTYQDDEGGNWRDRLVTGLPDDAILLDLSTKNDPLDPRPVLVFSRDPETLRAARRGVFGC
ncbi:MAG: hypothetical protein CL933_22755 [Deltaproteobacteria bacterium]|nr:hypothetical protein [Deltaproteobacteria bacterium]